MEGLLTRESSISISRPEAIWGGTSDFWVSQIYISSLALAGGVTGQVDPSAAV